MGAVTVGFGIFCPLRHYGACHNGGNIGTLRILHSCMTTTRDNGEEGSSHGRLYNSEKVEHETRFSVCNRARVQALVSEVSYIIQFNKDAREMLQAEVES